MYQLIKELLSLKTAGKLGLSFLPVMLFAQGLQSDGGNLVVTFRAPGSATGPAVTLTAKGRLVAAAAADSTSDRGRQFVNALVEANASGVPGRILNLWQKDDRLDIEKRLTDQKMADANRNLYAHIKASELLAYIEYGSYLLLFVRHVGAGQEMIRTYPVIDQEGKLLLTNALKEDMVFTYLSTIYERELRKLPAK